MSPSETSTANFLNDKDPWIDAENFAIQFTSSSQIEVAKHPLLIFQSENTKLSVEEALTIDALDWNSKSQTLLSASYLGREGLETAVVEIKPVVEGSDWILLVFGDLTSRNELYVYNLRSGETWGIMPDCRLLEPSISREYLAYRCFEDPETWFFISLTNPENQQIHSLSEAILEPLDIAPPLFFDEEAFFYPFFSDQVCAGMIKDWHPHCKELPFWLGPMSPDHSLFEVRLGMDIAPDEVGIIESSCILKENVTCEPILVAPPPEFVPVSYAYRSLGDSTWLPDSEGLLYMVHVDTDHTNQSPEESELWMYLLSDQSFRFLFKLPGVQYFGDPWFGVEEPGYWSPDGSSIVVSDWNTFSLLNISTGTLTPLTEGGILLGTITLP